MLAYKILKSKKRSKSVTRAQRGFPPPLRAGAGFTPPLHARAGFTFLEVVISLLILSVGALTMLQTVNVAMDANYRAEQEVIASNLASALLSEIMSKGFEETVDDNTLTWEPGESRTDNPLGADSYNDVDDYNGYAEAVPITVGGLALDGSVQRPNYQGFSRTVNVIFVNDDNTEPLPGTVTDYKRITVTVNGPRVTNFKADAIRSLY